MSKIKSFFGWFWAKKIRLIIALILLAVIFFVLRGRNSGSKVQYRTQKVQRGTIVSTVSASGQILTSNMINVNTQASGVVKTIYVKNGDYVRAGTRIAAITLDSDGAAANAKAYASLVSSQVALNVANNNYRATQATVQNIHDQVKGHDSDETPSQKDTRTKAEVANDNAYDNLRTVQANLSSSSVSYRETSPIITAPISGVVDNITITPGMVLTNSSGTTGATSPNRVAIIRSDGSPLTTFNVSEVDVNRVSPGQKATVTLDSLSGKTFTGVVLTVDKIGTVTSGVTNYPVVISLDTKSPEILPNMAATANIILDSKSDVLMVPSDAIQTGADGSSSVRVLRQGQPVNVNIETGLTSDTDTEVTSGLTENDEVIIGTTGGTGGAVSNSPFSTFRVGGGGGGGNVRVGR